MIADNHYILARNRNTISEILRNFANAMKTRGIMLAAVLALSATGSLQAQSGVGGHIKADIVSQYIWRGMDLGHVSVQPELSVGWKGLSLTAWGSVGLTHFKDDMREIDLTLAYERGGLSLGIVDYWNDDHDKRYFYYRTHDTGHSFEGFVAYDFGFLSASWQTFFAGSDLQQASGKRAFSSYLELSAPFRLITCEWEATVGVVPWRSDYYEVNRFNVTNVSLRATKDIPLSKSFTLPLFAQLTANPASGHFHFVIGLTVNALTR